MAALGIVGLFLTLLVVVVYYSAKQSKAQFERQRQDRRLRTVADVQAGRGDVSISDAELLEMLADDAQCVKTVTSIYFFMADLGDPRFRRIRKFANLKDIGFYECGNADNVILAAKDMPSVESLFFEMTGVSDESLQSLAAFPNLKKVRFEHIMADETIDTLNKLLPKATVEAPYPASKEP